MSKLKRVPNVTVRNITCTRILVREERLYEGYISVANFSFDSSCGLSGRLLHSVSTMFPGRPLVVSHESEGINCAVATIKYSVPVSLKQDYSAVLTSRGMLPSSQYIPAGKYAVGRISMYVPVLSGLVDVTFCDVSVLFDAPPHNCEDIVSYSHIVVMPNTAQSSWTWIRTQDIVDAPLRTHIDRMHRLGKLRRTEMIVIDGE